MRDETNAQADTASRATQDHENVEPEATSAAATADTPVGAGGPVGGNAASTASAASNPLDHVLEWIAAAAARGVQSQQVSRGIFDEPLPYRAEVDWIQALDLAMRRGDSERERLERVESKLAPIIAGTIAGLALFVDKSGSTLDYALAGLLLIPLAMLFLAFRTKDYIDTPNLDALIDTYERWPLTYIRSVVFGTADALGKNALTIDSKARNLNRTMAVLFCSDDLYSRGPNCRGAGCQRATRRSPTFGGAGSGNPGEPAWSSSFASINCNTLPSGRAIVPNMRTPGVWRKPGYAPSTTVVSGRSFGYGCCACGGLGG